MLIATDGGSAGWIVLWIVSIVIGIALYKASPAYPGMSSKAARARTGMLISGFLPCYGINIVSILIFYFQYRWGAGSRSKNEELQRRFNNPRIAPSGGANPATPLSGPNPFTEGEDSTDEGDSGPSPDRPGPSPDNPFV